jgi:histidine kinase/DNA gyrase B/HSP90-like ATPase
MDDQRLAVHRTIVALDVEGFGARQRTNRNQLAVRDGLYRALHEAFQRAGIPWDDHEDRGDGVFILVGSEVPKSLFIETLPSALVSALREHNGAHPNAEQIRLRMALHAGEVNYDAHGATGASINLTFRLLECESIKRALASSSGVLAVIVSSWFFEEVVRHSTVDNATYFPVLVTVKETSAKGWICLPDQVGRRANVALERLSAFQQTSLWRRTLGEIPDDPHGVPRQMLRLAYLQFRAAVESLTTEIAHSLPMFSDHTLDHIDALWDIASLVCGDNFPLNAAEAFVLGGAFILHDIGMGLASYRGGMAAIEADPRFSDLLASATIRLRRADPSASDEAVNLAAREESVVELLRLRHAAQAESLVTAPFQTSDDETFYLLQDAVLRQSFGSLIGRIAASHWWDVDDLRKLERLQGSCVDHPADWEVDPLKIACVLRLADAAHIDNRRVSSYVHAFHRPSAFTRERWCFQECLTRPRVAVDRLEYTAMRPFGRQEASAWWMAWETIQGINDQLRQVDALCADLGRPRFAVRSVAGAESPERLVRYIRTEGWDPIDARLRVTEATELIANLGGEDLYGRHPEVAMRELIANATDATRARAAYEGGVAGAVTVRLSNENGSWWLAVEDHGIGMTPEAMVTALTDFGYTRWRSRETVTNFPGLISGGFQPIGRFGIGFFAVFMVADDINVFSLGYEEAPRSTHVLEFRNGVARRPLLREAEVHERLRGCGTVVRLKLRHEPRSTDGLFKTADRGLTETQLLHSRLIRMCALAEIDIEVQGPDDVNPVRIVQANDWTRISPAELFRRLYRREEASHLDRVIYDGYEKLFVDRATDLRNPDGSISGRAMLVSGLELTPEGLRWMRPPEGLIYVGGLQSDKIYYCMGAFSGRPLTADRMRAWPLATIDEFQSWVEIQADRTRDSAWSTPFDLWEAGFLARGLGALAPRLPCAESVHGPLDRDGLASWLTGRHEVLLIATGIFEWHDRNDLEPAFFTFDGREVRLPDSALLVSINPPWLFPEEVLSRPRDERFAHATHSSSTWNLQAWWYDTGNFGGIGLVVRTIAEAWNINVEEAVTIMEPLYLEGDRDLRPRLEAVDGDAIRVTAIRMRNPLVKDSQR